jgi:hypothetical protein
MQWLGEMWRVVSTGRKHDVAVAISDETAAAMTPHFDKVYRVCQQGQAAHVALFAQCPKNIADKQGETLVMARTTLEQGEHEEYETMTGVDIKVQGDAFAEAIEKTVSDPLTEGTMRSFLAESNKMDGHHASSQALQSLLQFTISVVQNLFLMQSMIALFGYGAKVTAKIKVIDLHHVASRMTRSLLFSLCKAVGLPVCVCASSSCLFVVLPCTSSGSFETNLRA